LSAAFWVSFPSSRGYVPSHECIVNWSHELLWECMHSSSLIDMTRQLYVGICFGPCLDIPYLVWAIFPCPTDTLLFCRHYLFTYVHHVRSFYYLCRPLTWEGMKFSLAHS
jgi:hypothetical protein